MILFNEDQRYFLLEGDGFSYLLGLSPQGDPHHLHWGAPLAADPLMNLLVDWRTRSSETSPHVTMEHQRREFPDFGHNDLRAPAYHLEQTDGSRVSEFVYAGHEIVPGKPDFTPLPSSYAEEGDEAQTLKLLLFDRLKNLELELHYSLYPRRNILVRRNVLRNRGGGPLHILKLMSAGLDFPAGDYRLVRFPGGWANERRMQQGPLLQGLTRLESRRGISSHDMNPFAMVTRGEADERRGEVYGFALAYSGNWAMEAEVHRTGWLRFHAGLNDFDFKWRLEPGETFVTPECVMAYSGCGFGPLSRSYHRFARERVARGRWRDRARPTLINNWEATYFDFNQGDILRIAEAGKEAGVETVVLDDGWFGERDGDDRSLGDWFENAKKLPKGLKGLSGDIHALGLKFGLWIEPEMISPRSRLYEAHPDWCLHVPGRERKTSRSQLVLDMSRPEIRDHLLETIGKVLEEAQVDYVKWDMNRSLFEVGNEALPPGRQMELSHRYMLGVYDLMGRFNQRFPHILFEGCAGGGGRFDLGLLSYHPQIWTSDNSDGLDRLFIQYGTSFAYPPIAQGAHIAASPNHITKRGTPLKWRALVALSGNFGLEVDISKWSAGEREEVAGYVRLYKEIRPLVQFGDFHRLESPYDSDRTAWMFVDDRKEEALLFVFQVKPWKKGVKAKPVRLQGLDPAKAYKVQGVKTGFSGKKLMKEGWLPKPFRNPKKPYLCELYRLKSKV